MNQAQVSTWGSSPQYATAALPPPPSPEDLRIIVTAVGIHNVVRSRAAGSHYSATSKGLPCVPGLDGTGHLADGTPVYFHSLRAGGGTLAEQLNLPRVDVHVLPKDVDPIQAAALMNPLASSWMALSTRATLPAGGTVLIVGATSDSGRCAVAAARALGAARVVGAARNAETLADVPGLDERVVLQGGEATDWSALGDVDVILDYVYGAETVRLLSTLRSARPTQYVHIGTLSREPEMPIPGAVLRAKDLTIRGSGKGAWSAKQYAEHVSGMVECLPKLAVQKLRTASLQDVEKAWTEVGAERLVILL